MGSEFDRGFGAFEHLDFEGALDELARRFHQWFGR